MTADDIKIRAAKAIGLDCRFSCDWSQAEHEKFEHELDSWYDTSDPSHKRVCQWLGCKNVVVMGKAFPTRAICESCAASCFCPGACEKTADHGALAEVLWAAGRPSTCGNFCAPALGGGFTFHCTFCTHHLLGGHRQEGMDNEHAVVVDD